ncbi:hypothetical protein [Comamonas testosteroni]|nr:hypothetical protein [Comamonas testosteroni]WKL17312.1 hypothetical protein QYQ99_07270 [Comamonas testosteroni]
MKISEILINQAKQAIFSGVLSRESSSKSQGVASISTMGGYVPDRPA